MAKDRYDIMCEKASRQEYQQIASKINRAIDNSRSNDYVISQKYKARGFSVCEDGNCGLINCQRCLDYKLECDKFYG